MPSIFVAVTVAELMLLGRHLLTGAGSPPPDLREYVKNLFLIDTDVGGVTWTIRLEMIGVPVIFAVGLLSRALGLFGNALACIYSLYALQNPALSGWVLMLHSALLPFTVGMLLANARLDRAIGQHGPAIAMICLVAFLFARFFVDVAQLTALIAQIFLGGLLVAVLARSTEGALARILTLPFWQFMGRISYSYYLYARVVGSILVFTIGRFWTLARPRLCRPA
jgi:peptidoglycan/LPS O-acetylase OafA/YrhL